jgi:hypothetical protein
MVVSKDGGREEKAEDMVARKEKAREIATGNEGWAADGRA